MASNIGIAFEDVITSDPEAWSDFMKYSRLEGHSIIIIGQDPTYTIIDRLDYYGLELHTHWDSVLSVFSFLSSNGVDVYFSENHDSWRATNMHAWYQSKARICYEHKIGIMFESNPRFFAPFKSIPTRLVNVEDPNNQVMVGRTAKLLKSQNSWFEDYEGEIQVH